MKNIFLFIIDHDPGYERVKQALKTVLSVAITTFLIYWWFPGVGTLLGGFSAGVLSICHDGETRLQRMISMLIAGATVTAAIWIGSALTQYLIIFYITFIVSCFAAFYVRERYGPRYLSFPIFSLLLMMTSFISPHELNVFVYPMVAFVGLLVAFIINFYILRVNMDLQFKHNFEVFIHKYRKVVQLSYIGVDKSKPCKYFYSRMSRLNSLITKIKNERVIFKGMPLNINRQSNMKESITNQYELFKLLSMINESLYNIADVKITKKLKASICIILGEFLITVDGLVDSYYGKKDKVLFDKLESALSVFKSEVFERLSEIDPVAVVHLSNLIFGVQRTSKLLQKQVAIVEDEGEG